MNPITTAKLALTFAALVLIAWGMRTDQSALRLAGIGLLIAAVLLRFIPKRPPRE